MREIKHEGTFYTYSYLLNGAENAIETAREYPTGGNYQFASAILFCAFAIEAHLNHIGEEKLECWADIEKKLGPEQKLDLIAELIAFKVDRSRRPFQSIREIFKFRNYFAHGRTESIERTIHDESPLRSPVPLFDPEILEQLNEEYVGRLYDDTIEMITVLHKAAGFEESEIWMIASVVSRVGPRKT